MERFGLTNRREFFKLGAIRSSEWGGDAPPGSFVPFYRAGRKRLTRREKEGNLCINRLKSQRECHPQEIQFATPRHGVALAKAGHLSRFSCSRSPALGFGWPRTLSGLARRRTEATPATTRRRVILRSLTTPPASKTRATVLLRSLPTPLATTTRPTVFSRSITTQPAASTRPMDLKRSLATPPASITRPTVLMRSLATPPASVIRPTVLQRSIKTRPATTTRPTVAKRSIAIPPAPVIRPTVRKHSLAIPPATRTRLMGMH